MAAENEKDFIDIRELSARSGRSITSLRRDVCEGRIEAFQPGGPGGKLLFHPDVLTRCRVISNNHPHGPSLDSTSGSRSRRLSGRRPAWMVDQSSTEQPPLEG